LRNTVVTALIGNFFWTVCTHGSDHVVLQRYFSTSSLRRSEELHQQRRGRFDNGPAARAVRLGAVVVLPPAWQLLPKDLQPAFKAGTSCSRISWVINCRRLCGVDYGVFCAIPYQTLERA